MLALVATMLAQLGSGDAGVVGLRVYRAADGGFELAVPEGGQVWRDRRGRLANPPTGEALSEPLAAPVQVRGEWLVPLRLDVRDRSPIAGLAWGAAPEEVEAFARTKFVRQRWPVVLGGQRFFAVPHFTRAQAPALSALELESLSSDVAAVWKALEEIAGPPTFVGGTWRAWQTGESSVYAVVEGKRVKVLLVSRLFLLFEGERQ